MCRAPGQKRKTLTIGLGLRANSCVIAIGVVLRSVQRVIQGWLLLVHEICRAHAETCIALFQPCPRGDVELLEETAGASVAASVGAS